MAEKDVVKAEIKPGVETSEFEVARKGKGWAIVVTVFGMVTTLGSAIGTALGADTNAGIIVGAVVAVVGIIQRTLTDLGYIGGRSTIKAAAAAVEAKK